MAATSRSSSGAIGLVLASCRLGGGIAFGPAFKLILRLAWCRRPAVLDLQEDRAHRVLAHDGTPEGLPTSSWETRDIAAMRELLFPLNPRREGDLFDGFVSNVIADHFPPEQLTVPTLIIAARVACVILIRTVSGPQDPRNHTCQHRGRRSFFMGHASEVRKAIAGFENRLQ
jgi:hypothetical protein